MNRWIISLFVGVGVLMLFSGCTHITQTEVKQPEPKVIVQKVDREDVKKILEEEKLLYIENNAEKVFAVNGEGIAPQNTVSPAQSPNGREALWCKNQCERYYQRCSTL
jgi:hypothetical protein